MGKQWSQYNFIVMKKRATVHYVVINPDLGKSRLNRFKVSVVFAEAVDVCWHSKQSTVRVNDSLL